MVLAGLRCAAVLRSTFFNSKTSWRQMSNRRPEAVVRRLDSERIFFYEQYKKIRGRMSLPPHYLEASSGRRIDKVFCM